MAPAQEAELLRQAQRELASKQQMLHQVQEQLTHETAAVTSLHARLAILEAQLSDTRDKNLSLQSHLQVTHLTSPKPPKGIQCSEKCSVAAVMGFQLLGLLQIAQEMGPCPSHALQ